MSVQRNLRVAFVDRDGVINRDRDDYVKTVDEFEFLPGSPEALARLRASGWTVVLISNQASIGRGIVSPEELDRISEVMRHGVDAAGGKIDAIYYCTHRPEDQCDCRKPLPGMLLRAGRDLGFDPSGAVFIGDSEKDVVAGKAAGCTTVLVLTGKLTAAEAAAIDPSPDFIAADLGQAADWILSGNV